MQIYKTEGGLVKRLRQFFSKKMHFFGNPVAALRVTPKSGLLCLDKMNMENRNGDTCIAENLEYLNHLNAYREILENFD
jgi:hypothetical protein